MVFVRAETARDRPRGREAGAGRPPGSLAADAFVLGLVGAAFAGVVAVGRQWAAPLAPEAAIDLSLRALPRYALFSLSRGLAAYILSLAFTIAYGTAAASSRRAESILVPALDVFQSIPVLSFMPGFVLGLVALFPRSNVGLELACILAIFTGQVWNMTFGYHASLRAIPQEMIDVSRVHRFGFLRRLLWLEIPNSVPGLVWNSMMSMAGGWFFLTVVESFRLGGRPYRLPGLGSYMAAAIEAGSTWAVLAGILAMVLLIVLVDQILWRPVIAWAERFKHEETSAAEKPRSRLYDLLRGSRTGAWLGRRLGPAGDVSGSGGTPAPRAGVADARAASARLRRALAALASAPALVLALWGGYHLLVAAASLGVGDWLRIARALGFTGLRVACAVGIGAAWAVPAGIAIGRSPRASRLLRPVIQVAASFPAPMLYPLVAPALLAIGVGANGVAVTLMLLGTQWYILFNVVAGTVAIPEDLREVASVFGLRPVPRFVILYLGGVFPHLVTGLVTAAGGAWNASIVAEAVRWGGGAIQVDGIGALIAQSFDAGNDALLAAATLALAAALVLVNRFVWRRLYRIADERFALNR